MSDERYQKALAALNDPDAPEQVKAASRRYVERMSSVMAKHQLEGRTESSLADQPNIAGPTGIDALEQDIMPAPDPGAREAKIQELEQKFPGVARAFSMRGPSTGFALPGPSQNDLRRADARPRPPSEWHPPTPANPSSPFDSVWGKLSAVKQAMPDWAGGGTEHYAEPTLQQFRIEMAPVLGHVVETVDAGSSLYQQYADEKYAMALQKAQAEGRGIVREAYSKEGTPEMGALAGFGKTLKGEGLGLEKALTSGQVGTILHGADVTRVPKLPGESTGAYWARARTIEPMPLSQAWQAAEHARDLDMAGSPLGGDLGFAYGVLQPGAIGNMAAAPVGKVAGALPSSFVGAGATTLASEAPDVLAGNKTAREATQNFADAGLSGLPFGLLGPLLGAAGREEGVRLRETTPLGKAEEGGASITKRGVRPGAENAGLEARARNERFGENYSPDVPGMLAQDLTEPFTKQAHAADAALKLRGQPLREFEQAFADKKIPLKNAIREILEAKKSLVLSDGTVTDPVGMKKLDDLLEMAMSRQVQLPESALAPKNEQLLNQMERAADLHGDYGTPQPEQVARDLRELSTPTRPVTPVEEPGVPSSRRSRDTLVDVGAYGEKLPSFQEGLRGGVAGERLRSLNEARQANPNTFDITPQEAKAFGIDVGEGNFARLGPKGTNPEDLRKITEAAQRQQRSGSVKEEPFPHYDEIKRALYQDRDLFRGETDAIKQSQTHTLPSGEVIRGYSAANAQLSDDMRAFENQLELLGIKKMPTPEETAKLSQLEGRARGYGKGGRQPEVDEALRNMAAETGTSATLERIPQYRALKELQGQAKLWDALRPWNHSTAARLRLDPILRALIPYLERSGALGALEPELTKPLPPQADEATLEEIQRALQP